MLLRVPPKDLRHCCLLCMLKKASSRASCCKALLQMPQISHMLLRVLERCEPSADTTAQTTVHHHVVGVCLTLSTGGPISATLILIGARWRTDTAAQTTVHQHVVGV